MLGKLGLAAARPATQHRVLIVDDNPGVRTSLRAVLRQAGFETVEAGSAAEARQELSLWDFELVLLDLKLVDEPGTILLDELRPRIPSTVVVVVTANPNAQTAVGTLRQGAYDCLFKPFDPDELLEAIERALRRRSDELRRQASDEELAWLVEERTRSLHDALHRLHDAEAAIKKVACSLAEIRDAETGGHLKRIAVYARELAVTLPAEVRTRHGIDADFIALMVEAAPLHDIGKIGVPDHILLKRGPLTPQEQEIMRQHARTGERILRATWSGGDDAGASLMQMGCDICRAHHERYDGTGYPDGLAGDDIPVSARIIAIADVYDALATPRLYRPEALAHDVVRGMIAREKGRAFDPDLVDAFMSADARMAQTAQRIRDVETIQGHDGARPFGAETQLVAEILGVGA